MNPAESAARVIREDPRNYFDEPMHPAKIATMRRLTLSERFALGLRFLRSARGWLASGIRARHPEWSEEQFAGEVRRAVTMPETELPWIFTDRLEQAEIPYMLVGRMR